VGFLDVNGKENRREVGGPCVERACQEAIEAARAAGEPRISAPLEGGAFAALVPVYQGSEEDRELVGFVYATFRAADLVQSTLPDARAILRLEDAGQVLYDGGGPRDVPARTAARQIALPGRTWTLYAYAPAGFDRDARSRVDVVVGSVSAALSLVVFALACLQARARARAEEGERKLRESLADRDRVELARRALAGDFDRLIEHLPDGIVVATDDRIAYVNRAAAALLGRECSDLIGRSPLELLHPEDVETVRARIDQPRRGDVAFVEPGERRWVRSDGTSVVVEVIALPVTFAGHPSILVVARDVSERKEMQARLMMSDRLAALGALAAGVAHEINNPLAYTVANLEFLDRELRESGAAADLLEVTAEARDGAERVRQIVKDLRVFSRPDDGQKKLVDVRAALESAVNIASHQVKMRATLLKDYQEVPHVMAAAVRLGQVFLNLLVNAAQAIPEGNPNANQIRVVLRKEGDSVVVQVSDTGCGIPSPVRDRIFDPFFTTKPVGVGTGLGLSICHRIVAALGGDISVESEVGRGSTFRVRLPAGDGQLEETA